MSKNTMKLTDGRTVRSKKTCKVCVGKGIVNKALLPLTKPPKFKPSACGCLKIIRD